MRTWSRATLATSSATATRPEPTDSLAGVSPSAFKPSWWLRNRHLQTIWPYIFRDPGKPAYRRERIELPDGDFVDIDWHGETVRPSPVVVLLHGLEGSSESHYLRAIVRQLEAQGWRSAIMHFRGCSGEPNRLPHSYHSGDTADLDHFIRLLKTREPDTPLAAVGYSLGGNVLLKWCGETAERCPLSTAVAISVPFDLTIASRTLDAGRGIHALYRWWMLRSLKRTTLKKIELGLLPEYTADDINAMCTFGEFDDKITAMQNGFVNAAEYYRCASSKPWLGRIRIPTLILHSRDDPFIDQRGIPAAHELSRCVHMELSEHGGHVGFFSSPAPLQAADYWLDQRIADHLRSHLG